MILFILNVAGAVALLLWSVRLIRTGVERAFMTQLRVGLRRSGRSPLTAAGSGATAALFLQSSTAVAMLAAGFASTGTLAPGVGLAMLLGADVGSAAVAQVLLSPVTMAMPLLLVLGIGLFLRARTPSLHQIGRILTGLALVFVSLGMIRTATAPLRDSPLVDMVLSYLSGDLLSAFIIGAVLAWAMHSSVAAVLMFVTFLAEGLLTTPAASALVLGANLGGAVIPVLLTTSAPAPVRQMVLGNLALRGGAAIAVLMALRIWNPDLSILGSTPHRQVLNLHLAFNLGLAALALPMVRPMLRVLASTVPLGPADKPSGRISALETSALSDPSRALGCATREVLRMGEFVHSMLSPALGLYSDWDDSVATMIAENEDDIDRMHFETKLYIARIQEGRLSASQSRRAMDLATIANNLEDAGDQISTNLVDMARRMRHEGLSFSEKGWGELVDFHDRVVNNAQLALNVLMTGDIAAARQLLAEKDGARQAEKNLQASHLARLRRGNAATVETSNLHQETVRALKQVNTDLCFVAYPIAEHAGDLLASRLVEPAAGRS